MSNPFDYLIYGGLNGDDPIPDGDYEDLFDDEPMETGSLYFGDRSFGSIFDDDEDDDDDN